MIMQSKLDQDVILVFISLSIKYFSPRDKDTMPNLSINEHFRTWFSRNAQITGFKKRTVFRISFEHFKLDQKILHRNFSIRTWLDICCNSESTYNP